MSPGQSEEAQDLDIAGADPSVAELKRSNAELARFAHTVAHDLAEPLRTVAGFLELLAERQGETLDPDGRRFLDYALDGTERMKALLDGLLVHSLVHEGSRAVQEADLAAAADRAIADLRGQVQRANAEIVVSDLPTVRMNPVHAEQLFLNLISNAIKFRREDPPRIEISSETSAIGTTISVADNGVGVAAADRERIFRIFERGGDEPGAGIGLAICARIAEQHGGRIWVEETPGGGSTFKVLVTADD